jgi:hypothetical protein
MSDDLVKLCKRLSKHAHAQLSSTDLERIANRIEELEARSYTLAVAIMGGEDAPGYADSIDADVLADQLRKERLDHSAWVDAAVKVATATARRDALEEAANEVDCGGCVNVGCVDPTNCWHKAAQDIRALAQEEPTA